MLRMKWHLFVPNMVPMCSIFLNLVAVKQRGPRYFALRDVTNISHVSHQGGYFFHSKIAKSASAVTRHASFRFTIFFSDIKTCLYHV